MRLRRLRPPRGMNNWNEIENVANKQNPGIMAKGLRCQEKKETALWQTGEDGFLCYDGHYKMKKPERESAEYRFFCKENG